MIVYVASRSHPGADGIPAGLELRSSRARGAALRSHLSRPHLRGVRFTSARWRRSSLSSAGISRTSSVRSRRAASIERRKEIGFLVIGTVPIVVVGLPCAAPPTGGSTRCGSSGSGGWRRRRCSLWRSDGPPEPRPRFPSAVGAFGIGVAQSVALAPGASRSGFSIGAGMIVGLRPERAARFSFLLSIPAVAGAGALTLGMDCASRLQERQTFSASSSARASRSSSGSSRSACCSSSSAAGACGLSPPTAERYRSRHSSSRRLADALRAVGWSRGRRRQRPEPARRRERRASPGDSPVAAPASRRPAEAATSVRRGRSGRMGRRACGRR